MSMQLSPNVTFSLTTTGQSATWPSSTVVINIAQPETPSTFPFNVGVLYDLKSDGSGFTNGTSFGASAHGGDGIELMALPVSAALATAGITAGAKFNVTWPTDPTNYPVIPTLTANATGTWAIIPAVPAGSGAVGAIFKRAN